PTKARTSANCARWRTVIVMLPLQPMISWNSYRTASNRRYTLSTRNEGIREGYASRHRAKQDVPGGLGGQRTPRAVPWSAHRVRPCVVLRRLCLPASARASALGRYAEGRRRADLGSSRRLG